MIGLALFRSAAFFGALSLVASFLVKLEKDPAVLPPTKKGGHKGRPSAIGVNRSKKLLQRAATCLFYEEGARSAGWTCSVLVVGIDDQGFAIQSDVRSEVFSQVTRARGAGQPLIADGAHVYYAGGSYLGDGWNCIRGIGRLSIKDLPGCGCAVGVSGAGSPEGNVHVAGSAGGDPGSHGRLAGCPIVDAHRSGPGSALVGGGSQKYIGAVGKDDKNVAGAVHGYHRKDVRQVGSSGRGKDLLQHPRLAAIV